MGKRNKKALGAAGDGQLRAAAEERAARAPGGAGELAEQGPEAVLHELQVHQIELEMQNDELKRAQVEIEESRDRYLDLYEFAPVGYFTLGWAGHVVQMNLAAADLLGVPRAKLVGRGLGRFVVAEDLPRWDQYLKSVRQSTEKQSCELTLKREDGSTFYARLDSTRLDRPGSTSAGGHSDPVIRMAMSDLTERKWIDDTQLFLLHCGGWHPGENFFKSLARYLAQCLSMDFVCVDRLLGDGLTAQTVALYDDGKFQDDADYALKDTPCGDAIGKMICLFPSGVRQLYPRDQVLQKMGAESYVGVTLWSFDAKPIGLIAVIGRKPLVNPRLAEVVLKLVAVRAAAELERRQMDESLRHVAVELARSNQDLEQFAYVASHDLQEPLRSVSGFVKLLKQRYQGRLDQAADEYINFTVEGVSRMQDLITDLLTYSKVGTQGRAPELSSMAESLALALANLQVSIEESGAVITHDKLPTVKSDPQQLTQLFQNLIGNALKFRGDRQPAIHISAERQAGQWLFAVRDNGIGLDPAQADRIFLVFQRLHSREEYPGTGIGLAICKKIVERHGGRIWVESQPGQGSTFHFTLPAGGRP